MSGTNDFLPLAVGGSANVIDQATFAALSSLLANGFQSGVANSAQINKIFRQSSVVASAIAQIIADNNVNATDDGNVSTFKTNLMAALGAQLAISNASVQGVFKNLQASATGASASISISADEIIVENSSNAYKTLRSVALTVAGTANGANGLDTGSLATNTWYSLWVIHNGTTTAGLLSLSATAPTMPGGYTHKARVGWIRADASGNKYPLAFKQNGRSVQYVVAAGTNVAATPIMATGTAGNITTPTYVAVGISAFVPPTASRIRFTFASSNNLGGLVAPNGSYGNAYSLINPAYYYTGSAGGVATSIDMILESTNIYWASTGAALAANGWEDNL
ncbi:MAG: hypothetical protein ABFC42_09200 [Sulfuricella sp.]